MSQVLPLRVPFFTHYKKPRCCLRFGSPANDFIFDAIVDRMWEVAQGRFGARSMRACLESPHITVSQQRRIATAIILNSIPLATNPNGALLLTWLLDTSNFPSRYNLLAPRFTPHLSHLCTHKLASLTVLRIVNQKIEPDASRQIVEALFESPGDHVLTDVLGDQVNGVSVVHKILTSPFLDQLNKEKYIESTKRVLMELKVRSFPFIFCSWINRNSSLHTRTCLQMAKGRTHLMECQVCPPDTPQMTKDWHR